MPVAGSPGPEAVAPARVQVGIDAAITALHRVCVREVAADGSVRVQRFRVPPTLAGLDRLTERLSAYPAAVVTADPTSMTWLPLASAVGAAGGGLSLVGSRHAVRRRRFQKLRSGR